MFGKKKDEKGIDFSVNVNDTPQEMKQGDVEADKDNRDKKLSKPLSAMFVMDINTEMEFEEVMKFIYEITTSCGVNVLKHFEIVEGSEIKQSDINFDEDNEETKDVDEKSKDTDEKSKPGKS